MGTGLKLLCLIFIHVLLGFVGFINQGTHRSWGTLTRLVGAVMQELLTLALQECTFTVSSMSIHIIEFD